MVFSDTLAQMSVLDGAIGGQLDLRIPNYQTTIFILTVIEMITVPFQSFDSPLHALTPRN